MLRCTLLLRAGRYFAHFMGCLDTQNDLGVSKQRGEIVPGYTMWKLNPCLWGI